MSASGFPAWVRMGAKAVYVGQAGLPHEPGSEFIADPIEGHTYTVNWFDRQDHQYCLGFVELDPRGAWDHRCFRPAVARKSEAEDVALFKDIARQAHRIEERA